MTDGAVDAAVDVAVVPSADRKLTAYLDRSYCANEAEARVIWSAKPRSRYRPFRPRTSRHLLGRTEWWPTKMQTSLHFAGVSILRNHHILSSLKRYATRS